MRGGECNRELRTKSRGMRGVGDLERGTEWRAKTKGRAGGKGGSGERVCNGEVQWRVKLREGIIT